MTIPDHQAPITTSQVSPIPENYSRRILLAVTGLSPQVVTETLYALAQTGEENARFFPTEVHVLTTTEGARRAQAALLHDDGGQFHALLADYPSMGRPVFDMSHVHVIGAAQGQALDDIRTPEENAKAADAITRLVAELTGDASAALHASIAGGRKTMGFYLGYAFSLFARPQDRLSHVLVSSPFENHPDFFFPPVRARRLALRDGGHVDTADAQVMLASIPVVSLRHGVPRDLLEGRASYNETVAALQDSLKPPSLRICLSGGGRVWCGDRELALPPALLAWLAWWALLAKRGAPWQTWRNDGWYEEFLALYEKLVGRDAAALEALRERVSGGVESEKKFYQESLSKLKIMLRRGLGEAGARPYLLTSQVDRGRSRQHGLRLQPEQITLEGHGLVLEAEQISTTGFARWLAATRHLDA